MSGKGEGKSEEVLEMEEEALEEWISRGYDEDDFDLERMIEIWEEEDQEEMAKANAAGDLHAFERKKDIMESMKKGLVDWDDLYAKAGILATTAKEETMALGRSLARTFEPPWTKKRRQIREHKELIEVQEMEALAQQHSKDALKLKTQKHHDWEKRQLHKQQAST